MPSASGGVNIFENGDFENNFFGIDPSYTDRNFQPGLGPWISTNDRSPIPSGPFNPGNFSALAAGDAELRQDFYSFADDSVSIFDDLSASGAAAFGQQVEQISFWVAHPDPPATNILVTLFYADDSSIEHTYQTTGTGWEFFDITSQHDPAGELIGISFFGNVSGRTFLDDIQVIVAIPEPGSVTLLIATIGSLLLMRRRGGH